MADLLELFRVDAESRMGTRLAVDEGEDAERISIRSDQHDLADIVKPLDLGNASYLKALLGDELLGEIGAECLMGLLRLRGIEGRFVVSQSHA
ncbi:hypothetical protein [Bradyrhizobium sp.]|uniref:hypothetical protein n=1 Tax=Bradyrhizobium sp. TaxID=376 RepID=UPI004038133B